MILLLTLQLFFNRTTPKDLHDGVWLKASWQSCLEDDGTYAERIFTYRLRERVLWEFHFGPGDEFALYAGSGPPDEEHSHNDSGNLLGPAYHYHAFSTRAGGRTWSAPQVSLLINVVEAGGSREDCKSFEVQIERLKP